MWGRGPALYKYKRTSITTMRINSLVPFRNLIHSHWSVLLIYSYRTCKVFFPRGYTEKCNIQKSVKFTMRSYILFKILNFNPVSSLIRFYTHGIGLVILHVMVPQP